jgi:hypothetical protein
LRQRHICRHNRDQRCNDRDDGAQRQLLPGLQSLLVNVQSPLSVPTGSGHLVCTVRERSQHKPYVIEWERDRRDVVASFDTLSEGIIGYP